MVLGKLIRVAPLQLTLVLDPVRDHAFKNVAALMAVVAFLVGSGMAEPGLLTISDLSVFFLHLLSEA